MRVPPTIDRQLDLIPYFHRIPRRDVLAIGIGNRPEFQGLASNAPLTAEDFISHEWGYLKVEGLLLLLKIYDYNLCGYWILIWEYIDTWKNDDPDVMYGNTIGQL